MTQRRPGAAKVATPRSTRRVSTPAPLAAGEFPFVAVGGSAGGPAAIRQFLDTLPAESGMVFSLVQHLNPVDKASLPLRDGFHSADEAMLQSKEALQGLNDDLSIRIAQLQETLDLQRTTSSDLQNVLYSTDVAILFLDASLNIRFFTPATRALFNIRPGDIGRPLADLHCLAADAALSEDARNVLEHSTPVECEIEARNGVCFTRRILPYHAHDDSVEGVVITFTDVTDRKHAAKALEEAKLDADLANVAKSRFLAAASHDLRQPLQSLAFLQGLLAKAVQGDREKELVKRLEQTLGAMSSMLNTLLDINQIEAGVVRPEVSVFPIGDLLNRLRDEFSYHAQAGGLGLHVVGSSVSVRSDPELLELMMRNLISNAIKYTPKGCILVGCRRRKGLLSIEVWDTGIGIAKEDQHAIFSEYHQVGNAARERSRGMGLGLSIVQRLGGLLGHRVRVDSRPAKGSVFAIEVPIPKANGGSKPLMQMASGVSEAPDAEFHRKGKVLVIEDDPEVRDLLVMLLRGEGHRVAIATEAAGALDFIARGGLRPDVILTDYNLPGGMSGLEAVTSIRERLHHHLPAIVLTGDISTDTLRQASAQDCVQVNKPVKLPDLARLIQTLLPPQRPRATAPASAFGSGGSKPIIFVIDDNPEVREGLCSLLEEDGRIALGYETAEAFLADYDPSREGCLLVDAYLPGMTGLELLVRLQAEGRQMPAIMITGNSDVSIAVHAMKAGALDFLEKPISIEDLLASVDMALDQSHDATKLHAWRADAAHLVEGLTHRQHEVMDMVLAGHPSKNIAADLGISQRTVETHRASIMKKTGSKSLPALARMALAAAANVPAESLVPGD